MASQRRGWPSQIELAPGTLSRARCNRRRRPDPFARLLPGAGPRRRIFYRTAACGPGRSPRAPPETSNRPSRVRATLCVASPARELLPRLRVLIPCQIRQQDFLPLILEGHQKLVRGFTVAFGAQFGLQPVERLKSVVGLFRQEAPGADRRRETLQILRRPRGRYLRRRGCQVNRFIRNAVWARTGDFNSRPLQIGKSHVTHVGVADICRMFLSPVAFGTCVTTYRISSGRPIQYRTCACRRPQAD